MQQQIFIFLLLKSSTAGSDKDVFAIQMYSINFHNNLECVKFLALQHSN